MSGRAAPGRMRPYRLVTPDPSRPLRVPEPTEAVVVGAGVAGISAAVVLAERGVQVTVLEADPHLGGRLAAWPHTLPDGEQQLVEHGFHAFFRQYYTWRAILRRADPALSFLAPVSGYPVISTEWPDEDLSGLPAAPPLNLLALAVRSKSLRLRDLAAVDPVAGQALLAYDGDVTTERFDDVAASDFLERMNMSARARQMLFEAFARSFFSDPADLSAAELIAMFHFYFLGNPEGIAFDVPDTDHRTAIWDPLARHLELHGARILTGRPATRLDRTGDGWEVVTGGGSFRAPHVVLALDPGALRDLVAASPAVAAADPALAGRVADLRVAERVAVTRLWLDRDVAAHRAAFNAVSGREDLDSVAVYSRLERESADWAARTGGSVLELHSYACREPDASTATRRMRAALAELWPETADAQVVDLVERIEAGAPAFPPGAGGTRPEVVPAAPGLRLAGDVVEAGHPAGLMERAAMTGVLAANDVLDQCGARAEPLVGVPPRGLLAGLDPPGARSAVSSARRRSSATAAPPTRPSPRTRP